MSSQGGGASVDNTPVAIALLGLVGFGLVVHLGTLIASLLFGHRPLEITFSDSLAAAIQLPLHFSDPAAAWPENANTGIPGALAFWAVQLVVFAAIATTATMAWLRWGKNLGRRDPFGVPAHGGLATAKDLAPLKIEQPEAGRLTLGRLGKKLIATEAQTSLAVIGPTGCGKTAGFAIPALLEWNGPIIATSVKADLISATVAHRRRCGKVWIYDPSQCSGQTPSLWSPLDACDTWEGAMRIAAWLCEAAQPKLDTVSDGDYWYTQARKALAPYLFAAARMGHSMSDVVSWVDTQERDRVEDILRSAAKLDVEIERIANSPAAAEQRNATRRSVRKRVISAMRDTLRSMPGEFAVYADQPLSKWPTVLHAQLDERLDSQVELTLRIEIEEDLRKSGVMREALAPLNAAQSLWQKDPRLCDSVFATVQNVLTGYADPAVGDASDSDIDFAEWLSGDNTIYVVATSHEQARLRPVLTVLVQQAIRAAYDTAMTAGGTLTRPCLVMLDEAGNTAPLRDLPSYASTARSHGITLVSVWQDLAQVKAIYRDRAQTVLNNHRAKLFGTGIADDSTLEYVSRLIGEVAQTDRNFSRDLGGDRRSISEHTAYRRAAPIDVVRRIKVNEAVLLYGSELPAHVHLRPWFRDEVLRARAAELVTSSPQEES